jgi:uncharacterized protein YdeI (YjbR/CyaY-like superfamily)
MPEITETFFARDAAAWRRWLKRHHRDETEIWLVLLKRHVRRPSVRYSEAVEEALCYGWIDGILKRIDGEKHAIRFTPRKPGSVWSKINVARVEKLEGEGRMTAAGREAVRVAKENGQWQNAYGAGEALPMPKDLEMALKRNRRARANWERLPPGARRTFIRWVVVAKREETRKRRVREVVKAAAANKRPGLS